MVDMLECQEAIYRGRSPRLSLPDTHYISMYPAKAGYNKYVSRQNDRKYVSVVNTDEKFARKDFFGGWKRQ